MPDFVPTPEYIAFIAQSLEKVTKIYHERCPGNVATCPMCATPIRPKSCLGEELIEHYKVRLKELTEAANAS